MVMEDYEVRVPNAVGTLRVFPRMVRLVILLAGLKITTWKLLMSKDDPLQLD